MVPAGVPEQEAVEVINVGEPGMTTTRLLRKLRSQLEVHKPAVMVALVGGSNWSNLHELVLQPRHQRDRAMPAQEPVHQLFSRLQRPSEAWC